MDGDLANDPDSQGHDDELLDAEGRLLASHGYDYASRCWWCGQTADSGEHKYKRTDLIREFGIGPWKGQKAVAQVVGGAQRDLQFPGSARLKFSKVLCGTCNSAGSQKFDQAYEQSSDYIVEHEEAILASTQFHWAAYIRP